jgi:putative ABC transport system ATP-binding protein
MSAALEAEGLRRTFGRGPTAVAAVREASLSIRPGELAVLRGRSGSGKTTLLNLLGGLERPDAGTVRVAGTELSTAGPDLITAVQGRSIGFVFQSFALLPFLTAAENVEVPLRLALRDPAERDARVQELLERVGIADHVRQFPDQLSGGQQQRVGLARALANRPAVLIADEPTGQLDSRTATAMMGLIAEIVHGDQVAAVVATHDPRMAEFADQVVEMHDGVLHPATG